jgi:acetyltransferase-like isoleucine patch superfamily enzyme
MNLKQKLRQSIEGMKECAPTLVSYCKGLKRLWINDVKRNVIGFGNHISTNDAWLVSVEFDIQGNNNSIVFEPGCFLRNVRFFIRGDGHEVLLGRGCRFNNGGRIRFEDCGCVLIVGEKSTFEDVHLALTEPQSRIEIGKDCMFAYDIDVRTGDSHSILCQATHRRLNQARDVQVEDHVWVGPHSMLLKGVSLAKDTIVAAGAVVTRKFHTPGIIVGGNPARQLKDGVTWCRERIYGA